MRAPSIQYNDEINDSKLVCVWESVPVRVPTKHLEQRWMSDGDLDRVYESTNQASNDERVIVSFACVNDI